MRLFDTHCHLTDERFDEDRDETIARMREAGVARALLVGDGSQEALGLGGYLDVGINDTMKDLMVNFVGAVVFSIIGYFYVKQKGKGSFAARFIPRVHHGTDGGGKG